MTIKGNRIEGKPKMCPMCKKPFMAFSGQRVCSNCRRIEIDQENAAMEYAKEHPEASAKEIMDKTGASDSLMQRMQQEGRFMAMENVKHSCLKCGAPISSGKYCYPCLSSMATELNQVKENIIKNKIAGKTESSPVSDGNGKGKKVKEKKRGSTYSEGMFN